LMGFLHCVSLESGRVNEVAQRRESAAEKSEILSNLPV
jgi:hypothetical protein